MAEAAKVACGLQGYGDWSTEPPPAPKGTINAHIKDLTIPILNLDQITISGANISGYRESLTTTIDNTPPHYITCYTDG